MKHKLSQNYIFYLQINLQAAILQPIGDRGIAIGVHLPLLQSAIGEEAYQMVTIQLSI